MFMDHSNDLLDDDHHLESLQMFGDATCRFKPQDITLH